MTKRTTKFQLAGLLALMVACTDAPERDMEGSSSDDAVAALADAPAADASGHAPRLDDELLAPPAAGEESMAAGDAPGADSGESAPSSEVAAVELAGLELDGLGASAAKPVFARSRLAWRFDTTRPEFKTAVAGLAGQCAKRRTEFLANKRVAPVIEEEGLLPGDPRIERMLPVKEALAQVVNVAFCVYYGATPAERRAALRTVVDYIAEWGRVYVGDGNPINDRFFASLVIAADLVLPRMTEAEIRPLFGLLRKLDAKEIRFMGGLSPTDGRRKNNWMIRHLMIRTYANAMLQDANALVEVRTAFNREVKRQYTTPVDFTLSSCANLGKIGAFGSVDLQTRDAFLYHAAGLAEVMPLLSLQPGFFDATATSRLHAAVLVTKPYVLEQRSHPEFKCTTVAYDRERLAKDPSLGAPWRPNDARAMFRHARLAFPGIRGWTTRFLTPEYMPWFKVYLAGSGDTLEPPR